MGTVGVALIGSGRMGAFHAERLAAALGVETRYTDPAEAFADPAVEDARAALAIALAAAQSVRAGRPVLIEEAGT
jgi:3-hydroxyacyl-CoA dehydrogenase